MYNIIPRITSEQFVKIVSKLDIKLIKAYQLYWI